MKECKPLAVGAKVNVRDRWNGTPLENAVIQGEEVCAMLLKVGGDGMLCWNFLEFLCHIPDFLP